MILLPIAAALLLATPMHSDTPPSAPSYAQMMQLRSVQDVVGVTKLSNGEKAPANLAVPELLNQPLLREYLRRNYPEKMRMDTVTPGMGRVWMFVTADGTVADAKVVHSTGSAVLDSFMLRLVAEADFTPARIEAERVAVWMPYPVQLPKYAALPRDDRSNGDGPVFTPYTVKPELLNREEVRKALMKLVACRSCA